MRRGSHGRTAFVVSLVLLALEVAHVRLLSYVGDPRLVYAAIAIALTGMSAAAVWVGTRPVVGDVDARLARLCAWLSIAVVVHAAVLARIATGFSAASFGDVLLRAMPVLITCAVPYFVGGLALTVAVSTSTAVHRTWAAGLFGSAVGCFVLYPLLRRVGIEREIGALALLAALVSIAGLRIPLAYASGSLSLAAVIFGSQIMPFQADPRDLYGLARLTYQRVQPGAPPPVREFAAWDPMARVEVFSFAPPFGTLNDGVPIKLVTQDGGAGTILIGFGDHADARAAWTERSVYATGYIAAPSPERVLVIGLGGGVDVVTALQHGARDVTGVEINGSILEASSQHFASFQSNVLSRAHLVHADGRSFLEQAERRGERWSLIQMSGADTYSAGSGGAFMFSESYLYTVDAFERYFRALDERGVLALIRFGPEPLRAVISEARAMKNLGMGELGKRFIVLRQGICFGILASKRPLDNDDMGRLARAIEASIKQSRVRLPMWDAMGFGIDEPLRVEYAPGRVGSYGAALDAIDTRNEGRLTSMLEALPLDYSSTTDDRPFFFQFLKPRDFARLTAIGDRDFFASGLLGHARLVIAFLVLAAVVIVVPLASAGTRPRLSRHLVVAGLLGLAFMFVELVLIQRTVLVLGHPTASVSVTIASLLIGSGIGSMKWSPRVTIVRASAITVGALLLVEVASHGYADLLLRLPFLARAFGVALLLVPLGIAMGLAFPALLRRSDAPTRGWAIGINGLTSVLGSVVATPIAMATGFRAILFAAAAVYGLAALFAGRLALR